MTGQVEVRDEWAPLTSAAEDSRFDRGRIGPYMIGSSLRATALGEVVLAISEGFQYIVELDLFDALANTPHTGPEGSLMVDLAQASVIEHPHVAKIVGAGLESGVPYVVRRHRLGRTLAEVLERGGPIPAPVAVGLLYALATTLADLAKSGPAEGACSLGGFDARDVFLRFDGEVVLHGLGLQKVRIGSEEPAARDTASWIALARRIVDQTGETREEGRSLVRLIETTEQLEEVARQIRRSPMRDHLARRVELLGCTLRERFEDAIREERAFFELAPLQ